MKESIPGKTPELSESQAERELDALLEDPQNEFLTSIKANNERIENAETAREALAFAKEKIRSRLESGTQFNTINFIEGMDIREISASGLSKIVESVLENAQKIGEGGDAFVVIAKNEVREFPPEICYKFAIAEKTPRGRNPVAEEAELHSRFYELAKEKSDSAIGVPVPFYSLELGTQKVIAMEKLPAKSVDDILHGKGVLPDWFDADFFCDELKAMLRHFHEHDLYHRDMHFGNLMISQKDELKEGEKQGYIIDFGLSGESVIEEYAYQKDVAGSHFTYNDDYGIIITVKKALEAYKSRQNRGV